MDQYIFSQKITNENLSWKIALHFVHNMLGYVDSL